jgi:large subunit ribosomal protein L5e
MGFVKVIKTSAFYSRYQVAFRRRREGKTDYYARKRLIAQDKNKYNSPKYRLVVRFTNSDVIAQIVYSKIRGDVVMTAAYSHELPRYGVKVGLTNYASAYATGLLLARRHLKKLRLDTKYVGKKEADGEDFLVTRRRGRRPFLANLDVGLVRTTTGARVFSTLKGALDGGLHVPHSVKKFYGYDKEKKALDSAKLRHAIFGGHVSDYMKLLSKNSPSKYKKQFSRYIKANVAPEGLEALYKKAHAAIRKNPSIVRTKKKVPTVQRHWNKQKLSAEQRRKRVQKKLKQLARKKKREDKIKAKKGIVDVEPVKKIRKEAEPEPEPEPVKKEEPKKSSSSSSAVGGFDMFGDD